MQIEKGLQEVLRVRNQREKERPKDLSYEEKQENKRAWTTFWRRNINLYVSQKLGISIYPFQHVMLYLMSVSQVFFAICTRGLTKTFLVGLFATVECMTRPYSKVVITAVTIAQGTTMVKEKIEDELCGKLSPVLKFLKEEGLIKFTYSQEMIRVDFVFNNSFILVLPMQDSSRGKRATMLIYEECRLLKKGMLDSIFEGMAQPRQAVFLTKPEYAGDEDCLEEPKSIYITSARFKNEWFWNTFKQTLSDQYMDKMNTNSVFAGDIFLAMEHGLKTRRQYYNYKKKMSEMEFNLEIMNIMYGETENCYYSLESFKKNCVLDKPFIPPTNADIINGTKLNNKKKHSEEKRLLFIDFAFKDSNNGSENDKTVIGCMCGNLNKDGTILIRDVEHIETYSGSQTEIAKKRIRELYLDYEVDYIVPDFRNGGELIFRDDLSKPYQHEERGILIHGFTLCDELDLHVISTSDQDSFKKYVIDPDAIPCVIPIKGSESTNSDYHTNMRALLRDEKIRFLIDELELESRKANDKKYLTMESDMKARTRLAHIQTSYLINEAINLKAIYKDGKVKLEEPRSGTKDLIIGCEYGAYIMSLIENKIARKENQEEEFDISQFSFLSMKY